MTKAPSRIAAALLLVFLLLLGEPGTLLAQCAMCKTLLTNSPEGRAISGRFNVAILVMLVAPYVVGSFVLLALFREQIRERLGTAGLALRARFRHRESPV
ncbi:MAG TPA: hypothetical protein VN083_11360 [Vicinamibacteria bacterium]|nr:hypothetical protein [Vicinamibacteria bacterium]